MKLIIGVLISLIAISSHASDWSLYKAKDQVRVEYRRLDNSLLEIRAEVRTRSSVGAFLHLLNDTTVISQWVENAERVEIVETPDMRSNIVHTYFKGSWPASARDMVTQSTWTQNAAGVLTLQVTNLGDKYPEESGYVRMQQVQSSWVLTPEADGILLVQYQGRADPAGKLPHFIVNRVALSSVLKTMLNLVEMLPQYQKPYPGVI